MVRCEGMVGEYGKRHFSKAQREAVCMLPGTVSRRDLHDPHASRQPVLRHQPHRTLLPHLHHLVPRLLPTGRVRREDQSGNYHPPRTRRLPAACWRDDAADARFNPHTWLVV